jgi:predicted nucleic acid-binding protein
MIALLDNTVLSNFTAVGRSDLVQQVLGQEATTSELVWNELQAGIRCGKLPFQDWEWLPILPLLDTEVDLFTLLCDRLNKGEASCLAIAAKRHGRVFTDDRDARVIAIEWHIPVSGTLGLLLRLVDIQVLSLDEGDELLKQMLVAGYYSPVETLRKL